MSFMSEFKDFVVKGNVIDMVVGIIIGGVFGKIVLFFVNDVIMLVVGMVMGGVNFIDQFINLGEGIFVIFVEVKEVGVFIFVYGSFI